MFVVELINALVALGDIASLIVLAATVLPSLFKKILRVTISVPQGGIFKKTSLVN